MVSFKVAVIVAIKAGKSDPILYLILYFRQNPNLHIRTFAAFKCSLVK